jgi:GT2 family glycosyltransferase
MTSPRHGRSTATFAPIHEFADAAVVIVTYNNAEDIDALIHCLRREAQGLSLRVIVVDNDSTDSTLAVVRRHHDVMAIPSGGNLGYAAGINVGRKNIHSAGSILILNPDLRVEPGAIGALIARLRSSGAGIVVPLIADVNGRTSLSLRREPTAMRTLGDAFFGKRFSARPGWLSEIVYRGEDYRFAHSVEWATGAALLVSREAADALGDWDERYFLYSEEIDYFRRARDAGIAVWFEPAGRVVHSQGGSGASPHLVALMMANRVRYAERVGPRAAALRMRAALMVHEALRLYQPGHRLAFRAVFFRSSWSSLPRAQRSVVTTARSSHLSGAVIIPAHNEAAVIGRTLRALAPVANSASAEVIVVCNGCTDETARIAAEFSGVRVIELTASSKIAALNAGDAHATSWPRIYLDADIEISAETVGLLFDALASEGVLAARPPFRYDTLTSSRVVRSYFRARERMSSTTPTLWGAGVYGVSAEGHARFAGFPAVTADDLWVDRQYSAQEKRVIESPPVVVRVPRTASALLSILRRSYRGNAELGTSGTSASVRRILLSTRSPRAALDLVVYTAFALLGRQPGTRHSRSSTGLWERDESSRMVVSDES